ncbi:MAG: hypothetical protein ACFFAV_04650 [Candidatus Hermodarchaeota archaeon]
MESDRFKINRVDLNNIIMGINQETDTLYQYNTNEGKTIILIAERFYFRIESNLAATIIIDPIDKNRYQIDIIVAGGKHGLLGVTYGAEGSMLRRIKNVFLQNTEIF